MAADRTRGHGKQRRGPRANLEAARRSRAYKHERDHAAVMQAVQRELICYGHFSGPERADWHWTDAIPVSPDGSQAQRWFYGRDAIVLEAGIIVDKTYVWTVGLLGQLRAQAALHRDNPGRFVSWLAPRREGILTLLQTGESLTHVELAFGAAEASHAYATIRMILAGLRLAPSATLVGNLVTALDQLRPGALAAGFYAPGGRGPRAHFELILHQRGLSNEEIGSILGVLQFRHDIAHEHGWLRHRASVLDSLKHRIADSKAQLFQHVDGPGALRNVAQNLPPGPRAGVLFSKRVEPFSTATICL